MQLVSYNTNFGGTRPPVPNGLTSLMAMKDMSYYVARMRDKARGDWSPFLVLLTPNCCSICENFRYHDNMGRFGGNFELSDPENPQFGTRIWDICRPSYSQFLRATASILSAHMLSQFRLSVRLSVRHTGDSCKNG